MDGRTDGLMVYRPASSEQLMDEKLQGAWQDLSEISKGKAYESDGEKGKIGVEIKEVMKRWGEKEMEMWMEARFMASGWY